MSCFDASGVRGITLYENIGAIFKYSDSSTIYEITTTGQVIEITSDLKPDYIDDEVIGSNFKLMHNHTVKFLNYDLIEGIEQNETLNNVYGWIVLLTFNSGNTYIITSPFFFKEGAELNASNTHTWEMTLGSEVNTLEGLTTYDITTKLWF